FKGPHINTFGGNPLSTRAAHVTIDMIEKKHLVANAKKQGDALLAGLRDLAKKFPIMGEVRGRGLMIGVELVKDAKSKAYYPEAANRVLEAMRERGVLLGKGGRFGNILRIQPPLIFSSDDVNVFLKALESSLAHVSS
ncbi:MAG TPA: aminotransferase class III-fold pyridoxal phosphate-dependent enzyme, partial [Candidatus Baltobacteraceae bacterium]|nr:aminotransferase class III-fold pyridoxal phosphate-dependent enzyme [Candidatus Baltobacteraceae bacterium]